MDIDILKNLNSIAIMGGTFDPIHNGHLNIAQAVMEHFFVEKVLFIPAGSPWQKSERKITDARKRLFMTNLATMSNEDFLVSSIEIDRDKPTFTIDTILELKSVLKKEAKIFFITGADTILGIKSWKDYQKLLKMCDFIAITRHGYENSALATLKKEFKNNFDSNIFILEAPILEISSSSIRERILLNKNVSYILPESVLSFIKKENLYSEPVIDKSKVHDFLKNRLSTNRIEHVAGVCLQAVRLAKKYGVCPNKAYTAALFHDIAKEIKGDLEISFCQEYGIKRDYFIGKNYNVIHSFLGAEIAKNEFGVCDVDILNAIRFHTTGRDKMSKLEKVVYLADACEPGRRSYFEHAKEIEEIAFKNLNAGMYLTLKLKKDFFSKKGTESHPFGEKAMKYFKKKAKKFGKD